MGLEVAPASTIFLTSGKSSETLCPLFSQAIIALSITTIVSIKKNVPKLAYKKCIKDTFNVKGNLDGLIIEGKNLLKHEQDLIKKIKGKKFLINYNNLLKEKDINDELYAYNIHINKYIKQ